MEFTIDRDALHAALGRVAKVVPNKTTLPIITTIKVEADDDRLHFTATDMEMFVATSAACDVKATGAVCVPATTLVDFVASLPSGSVAGGFDGSRLRLDSGRRTANIAVMDADDFPPIPQFETGQSVTVSGSELKRVIRATEVAVAADDSRPVLAAIEVKVANGRLTASAADGFRMARAWCDATGDALVLLPGRAISVALNGMDDGPITLTISDHAATAHLASSEFAAVVRCVDGQFPELDRLIPAEHETVIVADRGQLASALKTTAAFRNDKNFLKLAIDDGQHDGTPLLALSGKSTEAGDGLAEIEPNRIEGPSVAWGANLKYVSAALAAIRSDRVVIGVNSPLTPFLIRPDEDGATEQHVIMPMTIAG